MRTYLWQWREASNPRLVRSPDQPYQLSPGTWDPTQIYIRNQKPWGGVQPSVFKRPSWWLWCPRQFENHCLNPQICGKAHVNTGHSLYPKFKASSSLNFCLKWSLTSVQQMLCHSVPGTLPVTAGQGGRIHWWTRKTGSLPSQNLSSSRGSLGLNTQLQTCRG